MNVTDRRVHITHAIALAAIGDDGELPTEFRIFKAGWNDTRKGRFLFDDKAAASVMAAFGKWGVDLPIDLEHQMLDAPVADPTARDARGWFRLEVRDGDLWVVIVKWTADGERRLSEKTQRYASPAFTVDPETKRITSILNVALVAMPATHNAPALVAASANGESTMTLEEFLKVIKALGIDPSTPLDQVMAKIKGESTDSDATTEGAPPPVGDGGADESTENPPAAASANGDKPEAVAAASARLLRLTGADSIVGAVDAVETFRASHLELEQGRQKLADERKVFEQAERRKLCADLVTKAGMAPAAVWGNDDATEPKTYLSAMPIKDLRDFVKDAIKASGSKPRVRNDAAPPRGADGGEADSKTFETPNGTVTLSARELATCSEVGAKPEEYAANKAARNAARASRSAEG